MSSWQSRGLPRGLIQGSAWALVFLPLTLFAQSSGESEGIETLETLKLDFQVARQALREPEKKLAESYKAQLDKLMREKIQTGELDKVLALKKELAAVENGQTAPSPAPEDFSRFRVLQEIYSTNKAIREEARLRKLAALANAYREKLEALQKLLTQRNRVDEAIQVRAELESLGDILESARSSVNEKAPFENSLGMKFAPVPIDVGSTDSKSLLFSIWETRVKDYQAFVDDTGRGWRKPSFEQGDDHPAVWIRVEEMEAFCEWLTEKERAADRIGLQDRYRLPADHEWSCAVGIGDREKAEESPSEKSLQLPDVYPWGNEWPPPEDAGNFSGQERAGIPDLARSPISGFNDGYLFTAPVGSFSPNPFGLYDMGGNVCESCSGWFDTEKKQRPFYRDASWRHPVPGQLSSSKRWSGQYYDHIGFRCVLETR